jgi:hypothetical protein
MKKLRLNTKEKSVILEMHKKMGYKSMVSETMDLPDVDKNAEIDKIMSELNVSPQELNKIKSEGEDKLLDMINCIPQEFEKINTIEDAKVLYQNKIGNLNEQQYKGSEDDKNYLYAMGGLLLLGIITSIARNASKIGNFFKRLFKKKPKCARR